MASWLTHLRIAIILCEELPDLVPYDFIVGNLAPDSGVKQSDGSYAPSKTMTHFKRLVGQRHIIDDTYFYDRYLLGQILPLNDHSFLLGYFCHLATDNLWLHRFEKHRNASLFLYHQLDFTFPESPVHVPAIIAEFLPPALIEQKIDTIRKILMVPPIPIVDEPLIEVEEFIHESCDALKVILNKVM